MLIKVTKKRRPLIKLSRVGQTDSGRTWIFTFTDPVHKYMQSYVCAKHMPAEAMEQMWDELWDKWTVALREQEWKAGVADFE